MKYFLLVASMFLVMAGSALAQSNPNWSLGFVPSPAQWNAEWSTKVDTSGGTLTGGTIAGGTMSGTIAGTPTFSGAVTLSGGGTLTGGTISGGTISGTIAGSPTFSGTPVFSGLAASSFTVTPTNGTVSNTLANWTGFRVVTAAGAVTAATTDHMVEVNKTVGAATTVNMPACNSNAGLQLIIIDGKGDANVNNITLTPSAGTINRQTTFVMNISGQSETVWYDGSQCVVSP